MSEEEEKLQTKSKNLKKESKDAWMQGYIRRIYDENRNGIIWYKKIDKKDSAVSVHNEYEKSCIDK
jgi:hypothetical protein